MEAVREDFVFTVNEADDLDFSEVKGQHLVKRAIARTVTLVELRSLSEVVVAAVMHCSDRTTRKREVYAL
ncbi:MAG TPA: hypothetical protein VIS99_13870 [Terrimicrobiaceae bacterium]